MTPSGSTNGGGRRGKSEFCLRGSVGGTGVWGGEQVPVGGEVTSPSPYSVAPLHSLLSDQFIFSSVKHWTAGGAGGTNLIQIVVRMKGKTARGRESKDMC